MWRFLIFYLVLASAGLAGLQMDALQAAISWFCLQLAQLSWQLMHLFDPGITLDAAILRHSGSGFALEVTEVCSGLPISWLLGTAVLSFPAPWRLKLWALPTALLLLQGINILRLISLLYAGAWLDRVDFDMLHEAAWPVLLHLWAIALFVAWLALIPTSQQTTAKA